jgi:hypothetical protein
MVSRSGNQKGGGYGSRVVKHVSAPKTEPKPRARNPAHVAQWGALVGNHATHQGKSTPYKGDPDFTRKGYATPVGVTDPVKAVGVGGGRTIYTTGSQCQTGTNPGNPRPNPQRDAAEQE